MSNIFDALEQARRERHTDDLSSSCAVVDSDSYSSTEPIALSDALIDAAIVKMLRGIQGQLNQDRWTLQLISAQDGEGVSFVAKRFARVSVTSLNKKVLLLKLLNRVSEADHAFKWEELSHLIEEKSTSSSEIDGLMHVVMPFKSCLNQLRDNLDHVIDVKKYFDLVIFDTPSAATEPTSIELASYVDAVIIVLEAEKTKVFTIESLVEKLKDNSTPLFGAVLNKRCFHIPHTLYSKLH